MAIYVKYGTIEGGVTAKTFEKQVQISSFQFGVGRGIASATSSATNREASIPSVSEVVVTKELDESSQKWMWEALGGQGEDCVITFTRTAQGEETKYWVVTLSECLVSGYSVSSGGDRPSESISINFSKFQIDQLLGSIDNTAGSTPKVSYDLATNVRS